MSDKLSPHAITADLSYTIANFTPNIHLRPGDADSNHGVVFGELDGYGDVAVKPHYKGQRARREMETLMIAAERGVDAVDPIMVVEGDLSHYLITTRRPGLSHLGQTNWAVSAESPELRTVIEPALEVGAASVAGRQNAGLVKLDSQVKNIVVNPLGQPVHVDAEATLVDQPIEARTKNANLDVRNLGCSALYRGLLADETPEYQMGFLDDKLLDPYFEMVDPGIFVDPPEVRRQAVQAAIAAYLTRRK